MKVNIIKINSPAILRRIRCSRHWLILIPLLIVSLSCYGENHGEGISDKVYFHIPENYPHIVVPVSINDSTQANLMFDSAAGGVLWLDSAFCVQNKIKIDNEIMYNGGVAWSTSRTPFHLSTTPMNLTFENLHITYKQHEILDWKWYMGAYEPVGMFGIPTDDTTHIWEINFEKEYLQIHPGSSFTAPEGTTFFPMEANEGSFLITMPITARFANGTIIKGRWKGIIDTGSHRDIILVNDAPEIKLLKKRNDAVWTTNPNGYLHYNEVSATVFDMYHLDSLRLYVTQNRVTGDFNYVIGMNFLKHFNVFLDLKNKRLGLQPLEHFRRIKDSLAPPYHFSTKKNKYGRNIIVHIADYESNYIRKSGLRLGDEVISIDGIDYNKLTLSDEYRSMKMDTVKYKIRRQGKIKVFIVHIDKNEKLGD